LSGSKPTSILSHHIETLEFRDRPGEAGLETKPVSIDHSRFSVSRNAPNLSSQNGFDPDSRNALDIVTECHTHALFEEPLPMSKGIPTESNKSVAGDSFDIGIPQSVTDTADAPEVDFGGEGGSIIQVPLSQINELRIPFTSKPRATPSSDGRNEPCLASTKKTFPITPSSS